MPRCRSPRLTTDSLDPTPALSPNGDEIFFTSTRSGTQAIYRSTRTADGVFRTPTFVTPEVSSPASDQPVWVSPDGCRLYIASGRNGPTSRFDFFVATRPK